MRRRRDISNLPGWATIFWGLALLSLMSLPSNFRAGADALHGHSLVQLWADAADGRVDHHLHHGTAAEVVRLQSDWFDPRVELDAPAPWSGLVQLDVSEHDDTTPAPGGIHLLLATFALVPPVGAAARPLVTARRPLAGRTPGVLAPPPRAIPAAA